VEKKLYNYTNFFDPGRRGIFLFFGFYIKKYVRINSRKGVSSEKDVSAFEHSKT